MKRIIKLGTLALLLSPATAMGQANKQNTSFYQQKYRADKLLANKDSLGAAKAYLEAFKASQQSVELYEKVGAIYAAYSDKKYLADARMYYTLFCSLTKDEAKKQEAEAKLAEIEQMMATLAENNVKKPTSSDKPVKVIVQNDEQADKTETDNDIPKENAITTEDEKDDVEQDNLSQMFDEESEELNQNEDFAAELDSVEVEPQPVFITVEEEVVQEDPVTQEMVIAIVKRQVEVTKQDAGRNALNGNSTDGENGGAVTSTGKRNPFASARNKKTAQASNAATAPQSEMKNDPLRNAYIYNEEEEKGNTPIYALRRTPDSPLSTIYSTQTGTENVTKMDGRWITTLRDANTMREWLILDIDEASNAVSVLPSSGLLQWQSEHAKWSGKMSSQTLKDKSLSCKYHFDFYVNEIDEVGQFISELLTPYFGSLTITNRSLFNQLSKRNSNAWRVSCTISLNIKPALKTLFGTLAVNCSVEDDGESFSIIKQQQIPCTFCLAAPDYAGFEKIAANELVANVDTAIVEGLVNKENKTGTDWNNLGYCYLNGAGGVTVDYEKAFACFNEASQKKCPESFANLYLMCRNGWGCEKNFQKALAWLADGRSAKSVDAINISADLIIDSPIHDYETACKWFEQVWNKEKDDYAALRLGQMAAKGEGRSKNISTAKGLFESSDEKEADYELAKLFVNGGKLYDAFKTCRQRGEEGSVRAMQLIAELYLSSSGLRYDFKEAMKWIGKAAKAPKQQLKGYWHENE